MLEFNESFFFQKRVDFSFFKLTDTRNFSVFGFAKKVSCGGSMKCCAVLFFCCHSKNNFVLSEKKNSGKMGWEGQTGGLSKGDFAYHCKSHDLSWAAVRHGGRG